MHTFTIPMSTIRAVLPTIPKTDVRFYLVGALFDLDAGRIVVTDGHRMVVCDGPKLAGGGQHIVPRDILATVAKVKKCESVTVEFSVPVGDKLSQVTITAAGASFKNGLIDGRFPDYARVIPRQFSQKVAQYNADYLADAQAALAEYHGINIAKNPPRMEHNGDSAGIMHVNRPGCFVVVMPMRTDSAMERDMAAFIGCVTDTAPQAAAA